MGPEVDTGQAARALGRDEIGTLEVGKVADLTIVRGDPRKSLACLHEVRSVYRDGREVVHEGTLAISAAE